MTNTDILLEDLEDVLDDATSIPLSKKCAVDVDKIKTIIEDIRLNTPQETKQAKAIVDSRNTILEEAKKEAAEIIKKAQEEARAAAASNQVASSGIVQGSSLAASADETTLLAAIIYCEAGNQSYEGQLAVGAVVLNRVKSSSYPNTIYDVIYQKYQFGPASSGALERALANGVPQTCYDAAAAALNGEENTGGALGFKRASSGHAGVVIGAHVFY